MVSAAKLTKNIKPWQPQNTLFCETSIIFLRQQSQNYLKTTRHVVLSCLNGDALNLCNNTFLSVAKLRIYHTSAITVSLTKLPDVMKSDY